MDKVWDLIKSPVVNVPIRPSFWHSGMSALNIEKWGLCDVLIYCGPLTPSHAEMVGLKEGLRASDHMKRSNWRKETKASGMVWHEENLSRHRCTFAEICGNTPKTSPNLTFNTYSELYFSMFSPSTPESLPERVRELQLFNFKHRDVLKRQNHQTGKSSLKCENRSLRCEIWSNRR